MLDALVIGGGPSGSNVSFDLVTKGFKVRFIDIKENIGVPNHCSGLVDKRVVDLVGNDLVLSRPEVADVVTPAGSFSLKSRRMYVLDRVALDKKLAESAVSEGAGLSTRSMLLDFKMEDSFVRSHLKTREGYETVESKFIIGADGPTSSVRRILGIKSPKLLTSVQFDIRKKSDKVKIILDRSSTSDFFAWEVPAGDEVEVGASGSGSYDIVKRMTKEENVIRRRGGIVPMGPTALGSGKAFLIGDAAGMSKATTGGGLYSAVVSGQALSMAIQNGTEILSNYSKFWFSSFGGEIMKSYKIRKLLDRFEKHYGLWVPVIKSNISGVNRVGDVDYPSRTLLYILGAAPLRFPMTLRNFISHVG